MLGDPAQQREALWNVVARSSWSSPKAGYLTVRSPVATPRNSRPPERWSVLVAAFAVCRGCRSGSTVLVVPRAICSVAAAR